MTVAASTVQAWSQFNPVRVRFGRGVHAALADALQGCRVLIVTSQRGRRQLEALPALSSVATSPANVWFDAVTENPGLHDLQDALDRIDGDAFDAVLAFGGGSAIDAGKVLAVAMSPECRGIALSQLLSTPALHSSARPRPLHAVPTTAGTGSEVTPFSTVWDHQTRRKHSLAGPATFPHSAWVDPSLTDSVPLDVTISTGLDAINQAAESIWNRNATPITLAWAARALAAGIPALLALAEDIESPSERDRMAECSVLAGLCISQTRTALCHSISYPLTAHFGVPHGLACAFTMPAVLALNITADDGRLAAVARELGGGDRGREALVDAIDRLHRTLDVAARVRGLIGSRADLLALQPEMLTPGRADNNLAPVSAEGLTAVLKAAWSA